MVTLFKDIGYEYYKESNPDWCSQLKNISAQIAVNMLKKYTNMSDRLVCDIAEGIMRS